MDEGGRRLLKELLAAAEPRIVILASSEGDRTADRGHVIVPISPDDYDVESLILEIRHVIEHPDQATTRHLAALQRSLSISLSHDQPIPDLLRRLRMRYNAAFALIDSDGRAAHATGPVPLRMIYEQISLTTADSQRIAVEGWNGVAARIHPVDETDTMGGWLVAATRRNDFADQSITAAVHIAATLVETSQRVAAVARGQERAVRAALLEQAIALRPVRGDQQLGGRIAGLGISFGEELRVAVLRPRSTRPGATRNSSLAELDVVLQQTLAAAHVPALTATRNGVLTALLQTSPRDLRRLLISSPVKFGGVTVGVGRRVTDVGDVADSYHDAQLALRMIHRRRTGTLLLSYEDFDMASRLFADVGLERMESWARRYLDVVIDKPGLLHALVIYFEHDQNINAAARALGIHPNSLRYRLTKVEELLDISLRSPSAIASLLLALTALDLSLNENQRIRPGAQSPPDSDATGAATDFGQEGPRTGVVRGSDS
ncbi:hypothetical protein HC031_09090 [Planosporangium thailandense]|uniref:CdaR family transcriptional regulator n=1 Tax=Planosporangium thailandense TaxID=765197 RepID=A0ABX0XV22_9ACTN|nr:helix-turn-helix domain-containing protein [Planosporangium thailandense]NJC69872.1 hypothetical protein [Planosporangium thailandense]